MRPAAIERFAALTFKTIGCWVWRSALHRGGYGLFWFVDRAVFAHRWAFEYYRGPIPGEMELDHLCRNRWCVNPQHLEIVTPRENVLRGMGVTAQSARRTHCFAGHPLVQARTQRWCPICHRATNKRYMARKRLAS